ncbi:MAG: DUF3305 domain-containing protein [Gammaproteobacteria bacterium]|nr:DUF3305 domain-containing protein [Gammaproteobacteria bacterium]
MLNAEDNTSLQSEFLISVVLKKTRKQVKQWSSWDWSIAGVVVNDPAGAGDVWGAVIQENDDQAQYLFRGMRLQLFKDGCEGYWYNLTSEKASLFLVCDIEDESMAQPMLITANQDEAMAHMESDELVLSTPIPPQIYHHIEAFVVANYLPAAKKKRKRRDWVGESEYAKRQQNH